MIDHGFDRKEVRHGIRPDAIDKFGYLSEIVQVKASIVLTRLLRRGVRIDLARAKALEADYRRELTETMATLERDYPEVLTRKMDGTLRLTEKGQTPSLGSSKLTAMLHRVAQEIGAAGHPIEIPLGGGKNKDVSRSIGAWGKYADLHPFLGCWARMSKTSKLLGLFGKLESPIAHSQYGLLTRTGRTSCSKPRSEILPGLNLQQVPNVPRFRALFRPAEGHLLFTGDYAAVELRTLAAVYRARFGSSKLGEVIAAGIDPHAYTAASIQGLTLEEFMQLKETDPDRYKTARQSAKAINFGIPGGLGAATLVAYALANYKVTLTLEQAERFRRKLIDEVYPELNDRDGYLADDSMAALAKGLGVKEREAWEVLDKSGKRKPLAARGVANVVRGRSSASEYYQATVWDGLLRLARTSPTPNAEVMGMISRKEGEQVLHGCVFRQSALTLTGRIRAGVGYTDGKNTPFQSLAADGAKLALWNLLYRGFDVYGFVHDEILVQLPTQDAERAAKEVERVMVASMEEVLGDGIPAACEYAIGACWAKP